MGSLCELKKFIRKKGRQRFWLPAGGLNELANCNKLRSHYKKSEAASSDGLRIVWAKKYEFM